MHRAQEFLRPAVSIRPFTSRVVPLLLIILLVALACSGAKALPTPTPTPTATPTPVATPTLAPSSVILPQDDGPHGEVSTEWWYYNGHLATPDGRRYGFHYVVFEVRLPLLSPVNIAHLAITDHQKKAYVTDQRQAVAVPRAKDTPGFAFEMNGWLMSGYGGRDHLAAFTSDSGLELRLEPAGPPALHGGTGLLDFGQAGQSYYYSRTRLAVSGTITADGKKEPVKGQAWFDHQWGNFQPVALGWDWFALQLDDGSDVMAYEVREQAGGRVHRYGTLVDEGGKASPLVGSDFRFSATGSWVSPTSNATYPMGWAFSIPNQGIDVTLTPVIKEAEFDATRTTRNYYWEGEVTVSGSHKGLGFVEMVGYAAVRLQAP